MLISAAVVGRSGSGKSNLLSNMILAAHAGGNKCLVIDLLDRDFRSLAPHIDAKVFTQRKCTQLKLNPFDIAGLDPVEIEEFAKDFLLRGLALFPPQDNFISRALEDFYSKTLVKRNVPEFIDFAIDHILNSTRYKGKLSEDHVGSLDSRLSKLKRTMVGDTSFDVSNMLETSAILELTHLRNIEDKAIVVLYILQLLYMVRQKEYMEGNVTPVYIFIDEVSMLTNNFAESDLNVAGASLKSFILFLITHGRKLGIHLVTANQDMRGFEAYFEQSHMKVLMNSSWNDALGKEYVPYKHIIHRLQTGQAVCSLPAVNEAFMFQTPRCEVLGKLSDEETFSYMKTRWPESFSEGPEVSESDTAKGSCLLLNSTTVLLAGRIIQYITEKLTSDEGLSRGFSVTGYVENILAATVNYNNVENRNSIISQIRQQIVDIPNKSVKRYIETQL